MTSGGGGGGGGVVLDQYFGIGDPEGFETLTLRHRQNPQFYYPV